MAAALILGSKQYGMVTRELVGNSLAQTLGKEFEEHLKS
ncbi:hypothetical protein BANRA_03384 [Acinetobacter baumannii]|nr:hypothetical protein BANRA_03384 [Acinetobacter baumannii]